MIAINQAGIIVINVVRYLFFNFGNKFSEIINLPILDELSTVVKIN